VSERTTDAVRTLVLEDDPADVELVRAMLTHAGLVVNFVVVDSRESFIAALREHEFELILADYMLPSFDGLSALKLAREVVPEVPFIIVSAVLGEERAIDTLKSGATDYVLKQRLERVVPAVKRAMNEVRERRERQRAQQERERLAERERHLAQRLRGMTEASLAIASALSLDDVLQLITDQARDLIGTHEAVTSVTMEKDGRPLVSVSLSDKYSSWLSEDIPVSWIYPLACPADETIRMTQEQLAAHPKWHEFNAQAGRRPPMRGCLAAPLVEREGKVIGAIQLSDKYEGEFDEEDEAVLIQLAHMASASVQNARLYREAQQANKAKDDFIATLSHELRTPMTAILGWVQMLRSAENTADDIDSAIEMIENSTRVQARIIEDLLDVSRIIAGKLSLEFAPVELEPLVRAAERNFEAMLQSRHLDYIRDIEAEPLSVWGDPTRLQQIIWNLLSNAIKFTPDGGRIQLSLHKMDGQAVIAVTDTGEGIESDFIPHVFERFRQASEGGEHKPGLGLGLAIVRHLVDAHGGTVTASSDGPGAGATFMVSLPLTPIREVAAARTMRPDLDGIKILVVDDDAGARSVLTTTLSRYGGSVRTAESVAAALEMLRDFPADVVVSDIAMPGEDGYALIRKLKDLEPELGRDIPAMALTAYGRPDHHARIVSAGFQRYVQKPVEADVLAISIGELVGRR
jgi:signal transduction histidine kinase/DNA-binding response OmpR family regulator